MGSKDSQEENTCSELLTDVALFIVNFEHIEHIIRYID